MALSQCDGTSKFEVKTMADVKKLNLYEKTLAQIRMNLSGKKLFVALTFCDYHREKAAYSETLANVIVGALAPTGVSSESKQYFMLKSVPLDSYKNYTSKLLCQIFEDSMNLLWPDGVSSHRDDILLFITEETDSVITTLVEKLSSKFTLMVHLPCVSRILSNVTKDIRLTYPKVETFYHEMNETILSDPSKNVIFYEETKLEIVPNSFIEACSFYYQNFQRMKLFFLGDTKTKLGNEFIILEELIADPSIEQQLQLIDNNYSLIASAKKNIVKRPVMSLEQSLGGVEKFRAKLESLENSSAAFGEVNQVSQLLNRLLNKSSNYNKIVAISKALTSQNATQEFADLLINLSKEDIELFRFAPLGGLNRKRCFPEVDEYIYADLSKKISPQEASIEDLHDFGDPRKMYLRFKKFPVDYIDQLSVVNCFDQAKQYAKSRHMKPSDES